MKRTAISLIVMLLALAGTARASNTVPSAWDPPDMTGATQIDLSTAATTQPNDSWAFGDPTKNYKFVCSTNPVVMPHNLSIWGGHNIEIDGCDLQNVKTCNPTTGVCTAGRGLYLQNTNGVMWVHDVHLQAQDPTAPLNEGIDLSEPNPVNWSAFTNPLTVSTVVLRDVLVDQVSPTSSTDHSDVIQTWSGPQRLLIDGLCGSSTYQGFFLLPNQHNSAVVPLTWDFRHICLHLTGAYAFAFGTNGPQHPDFNVQNVYVSGVAGGTPEPRLYPGGQGFEDAMPGSPPNGDYVTANGTGVTGADDFPIDPTPLAGEGP